MLSLHFPLSTYNTFAPQKPKHFYSQATIRHQSPRFPAVLAAKSSELALKDDEEKGGVNGGISVGRESSQQVAEELPAGLLREAMPRHVAVIMDGNVRWAKQRGLLSSDGHQAGVRSLKQLLELCGRWGIKVLTVFAFSYDNWIRPKVEVDFLMSLFERVLKSEFDNMLRDGIRVSTIGDSSRLPKSLQGLIADMEEKTKKHSALHLIVAVSYSGKYDVVQACRSIAGKVNDGLIQLEDINENLIEQELETNCCEFPCPDLLIRTSGELRISNFLLWQLAYTELFFAEPLWPDFGKEEFIEALTSYQRRQRRFGGRSS